MSLLTTASLDGSVSWTAVETNQLSKISDIGSIGSNLSLTYGTGNSEIDTCWHDVRLVSGSQTDVLDLTSLVFTLFGQDGTVSFHNVKGIVVKNQSENIGEYLTVCAIGSNALKEPFNNDSGNMPVHPTAAINLMNPIVGYTVDGSHKNLSIINPSSSGVTYEIAIVGVTG